MYRLWEKTYPRKIAEFENVEWDGKEGTLVVMEFDEDWSGGTGLG